MPSPSPQYIPTPDAAAVAAAARSLARAPGDVVCVTVAEGGSPNVRHLAAELRAVGVPAFGGLFPGVIHGGRVHGTGVVLHAFPGLRPPALVRDLCKASHALRGLGTREPGTAFVFLSGRALAPARFLRTLFDRLGAAYRYVGAGAGAAEPRSGGPCVFAEGAVAAGGAVVAPLDLDAVFEAAHGYRKAGAPLVVTRAVHNVVHELNWEPAAHALAAEHSRAHARPDGIVGLPLGLHREGREPLVREVVAVTAGGGLVCIGEVPENAVLNRLEPDRHPVASVGPGALERALGAPPSWYWAAASAARFRPRTSAEDLEARVRPYRTPAGEHTFGVLSLGEVAYGGRGCLELTGRTLTIGALARRPDESKPEASVPARQAAPGG